MKTLTNSELNHVAAGEGQDDYFQQEVELANWSVYGSGSRDHRGELIFNRFNYRQSGLIRNTPLPIIR